MTRYGKGEFALGPYVLKYVDSACTRFVASASNGAFGGVPAASANANFRETMAKTRRREVDSTD